MTGKVMGSVTTAGAMAIGGSGLIHRHGQVRVGGGLLQSPNSMRMTTILRRLFTYVRIVASPILRELRIVDDSVG